MRTSLLGSVSIICFAFSTSAWGAPVDADGPPAASQGATPPTTPPADSTPAPTPAAAPSAAPAPDAAPDAPSPKPLTGPVTGPLPPEGAALPTLPSTAPALNDAPLPASPPKVARRSEWGVQLRFEGAALGSDAADGAGMGGVGFSLRPRPSPYFALDFGVDFIGGKDFNGDKRSEVAFAVNPMIFLNSSNKVQLYIFAGLGFGGAHVDRPGGSRAYNYIGADAGAGLEFRFWRHFAFSGDVMAFIRDRSDLDGGPEYIEAATGRYTDSSAGALFRLGGTYYW